MKIAVVGSGISGITAAYLLDKEHDVTLLEKENRIGGHTNTISFQGSDGESYAVDTGFIVLNDCNYGVFHNLLSEWEVDVRWSDMSFSYYDRATDYYYAGTDIFGLFPKWKLLYSKEHLQTIYEIVKFGKTAISFLESGVGAKDSLTLGRFLNERGFSKAFLNNYLLPMGSAIWSVPTGQILEFPALSFIRFFKNHGLLSASNRPRWQTIKGGSSAYLSKFKSKFNGTFLTNSNVSKISRSKEAVELSLSNGEVLSYDEIVLACHADGVLSLLENPSEEEERLFSEWKYENNTAILHTDSSIMPPKKVSWASWNYHANTGYNAVLTYYMNKLQGVRSKDDYFVSLNCEDEIAERKIIKKIDYTHPIFSLESLATQSQFKNLQGQNRTYYCGSYMGNGFHEDGARSGAQVALMKGITL